MENVIRFDEINKLETLLVMSNIPYTKQMFCGGYQIAYPNNKNRVLSAITHTGSYGRHEGLIEIMGLLTEEEEAYDSVVGYLTAENVFDRILAHHTSYR